MEELSPAEEKLEAGKRRRALFRGRALITLGLVLLAAFGGLTAFVLLLHPLEFDVPISHAIQGIDFEPWNTLMRAVSEPGFAPWSFLIPTVIVVGLLLLHRFLEAGFLAVAVIGSATLQEGVKALVHRARPTADQVHIDVIRRLDTYSFPSGHVTEYTVVAGFCFYLLWTEMKPGIARSLLLALSGALIVLVGPSRVWLGEHWPSDALGGYALGFGLLLVIIWAYRARQLRSVQKQKERETSLPPDKQDAIMAPTARE
ncbi:MAG: phosphatase PAP2 family protein [Chloroflexia bacterium]